MFSLTLKRLAEAALLAFVLASCEKKARQMHPESAGK